MLRWVGLIASAMLATAGCSSGGDGASGMKSCSDACAAVFACAGGFGYDLSDTIGTQAECVQGCESSAVCGAVDARNVTTCVANAACTTTIDAWSLAVLACSSGDCGASLPLPVGACDRIAAAGTCSEQLGGDAASVAYGKAYCENVTAGTWVASCPTAGRIAQCLSFADDASGGRGVYYATFAGDLAAEESACRSSPYFRSWTKY